MRAVLYIAQQSDPHEKVGISSIAEALDIPKHYLAKLLQQLSGQDVVQSIKGPGGGFYLTEQARRQPLIRIIDVIDGQQVFKRCALGLAQCSDTHPCAIHRYIVPFRDAFYSSVRNTTIEQLQREVDRGEAFIINLEQMTQASSNSPAAEEE